MNSLHQLEQELRHANPSVTHDSPSLNIDRGETRSHGSGLRSSRLRSAATRLTPGVLTLCPSAPSARHPTWQQVSETVWTAPQRSSMPEMEASRRPSEESLRYLIPGFGIGKQELLGWARWRETIPDSTGDTVQTCSERPLMPVGRLLLTSMGSGSIP